MVWLIKSSRQLLDSLSNQHHGAGDDNVRKRHTTVHLQHSSHLPFLQRLPVPHVAFLVMKLLPVLLLTQRKVKGAAIAADTSGVIQTIFLNQHWPHWLDPGHRPW